MWSQDIQTRKQIFKYISSKSWEHPTDKAALSALEAIPGIGSLVRTFVGATTEKSIRLATLASAIRVSENQFPRIYALYYEACKILDMPKVPELFISQNPFMNAGAIGVDDPFIVLNSSMTERLNEEELMAVIGHELGHCMSGHVLYKTLLRILINLSLSMVRVPLSGIALMPIIVALKEWSRKSELSSDRAGLLVVQKPEVYYSLLLKMAGGSEYSKMNIDEFFKQAREYEELSSFSDSVHKVTNMLMLSHPFPVLRLIELKTWVDSGKYQEILFGDYVTRGEQDNHFENFSQAGKQFREDAESTKGPLGDAASEIFKFMDTISEEASELKDKAIDAWDSLFSSDKDKNSGLR